jgi:peptidoglycan/xylan/chitin deacetylase (PgdA/CDA1 family)
MGRPPAIEWPDKARICVTFIVPWEVWPENFATHESLQRQGGATIPPAKAVHKQNMALVTEREYGDRVGIWRLVDLFDRHALKVTFLMNGLKVEQFAAACREFHATGHEFSSESYEHEYSFMYTREQERESIQKTVAAFEKVLGKKPTGYLSPGHASTPNTLELVAEAGFVWWADPLNSGRAGRAQVFRFQYAPVRFGRALSHQDHRRVHPLRQRFSQGVVRAPDRNRRMVAAKRLCVRARRIIHRAGKQAYRVSFDE